MTGCFAFSILAVASRIASASASGSLSIGGGAKFLNKPFKKLGWQIVSLKEPQFANAKGFLKLGLAQEGFTGEIIWEKESQKRQKMTDIDVKDRIQKKENNLVTITTDSNSETTDNIEDKRGEANEASNH